MTRRQAIPSASSTHPNDAPKSKSQTSTISLLDGLHAGTLVIDAKGTGDGRMTLEVTNRSRKSLHVVLPPGLVATSATGQFGGMGGMMGGGGMGGMGMGGMGGMMGGMGGGMGGMGMGGMGGGMMGGRGGMGGRGMMGGGTMPAMMGMMMLGKLIMTLVAPDSWDYTSLYSSMGGMMGGMGGMGGGMMGGMGGMGMGGGMGGMGFRSVPPTGLPEATLKPNQTRSLPTQLVSLRGPLPNGRVVMPAKGETLRLGSYDQINNDAWAQAALKRLAEEKAPSTVAQLVMWHVADGFAWETIAQFSKRWANAQELALAKTFVKELRDADGKFRPVSETATLHWELTTRSAEKEELLSQFRSVLQGRTMLGLTTSEGVPAAPDGPSLAVRLRIEDHGMLVQLSPSNATAEGWDSSIKFPLKLDGTDGKALKAPELADALANAILGQLTTAQLVSKTKGGKAGYQVRVVNDSPLVLNGLVLGGANDTPKSELSLMAGLCIPPHKDLTLPASGEVVERLGLKDGARIVAADLSGL